MLSVQAMSFATKKKVIIGTNAVHPPFTFVDEKSHKVIGHDIELLKKILTDAGYEIEVSDMKFDALIPAIQSEKIDVIACALSNTPERAKKIAFTNSYFTSKTSIAVLKTNNTIKDWSDLKGKKIGLEIGTIQSAFAQKEAKKLGFTYTEYDSDDMFNALKTGKVDAVIVDTSIAGYLFNVSKVVPAKFVGKQTDALDGKPDEMSYGVGLKNKELVDVINKGLEKLKNNGWYDKNYEKYYGKKSK
jgi:polar amino acid transport system substrate-binding protein